MKNEKLENGTGYHLRLLLGMLHFKFIIFSCAALPAPPQFSVTPSPGRTNTAGGRAMTNVVLTWDAYTNAWFEVMGCTNLVNPRWYHVTNVPVTQTSQVIPVLQRQEFFKVCTRYNGSITTNQ